MGLYMEISRVPLSTVVSKHKVHLSSRFSQILIWCTYYSYSRYRRHFSFCFRCAFMILISFLISFLVFITLWRKRLYNDLIRYFSNLNVSKFIIVLIYNSGSVSSYLSLYSVLYHFLALLKRKINITVVFSLSLH